MELATGKEGGGEEAGSEEEAEGAVDWELTDYEPAGRRLLRLTLRKQVPHLALALALAPSLAARPVVAVALT